MSEVISNALAHLTQRKSLLDFLTQKKIHSQLHFEMISHFLFCRGGEKPRQMVGLPPSTICRPNQHRVSKYFDQIDRVSKYFDQINTRRPNFLIKWTGCPNTSIKLTQGVKIPIKFIGCPNTLIKLTGC